MKKFVLVAAAAAAGLTSCKKILDVQPEDQLDVSQMYRNVYDADAAIIGLYGKFQGLAERYILLNELRADMLDYTVNADEYLRQLSTHSVTPDNPYASPRPFYELIVNCNDVLKHFNGMRKENKLKEAEYNQRYSDVACLRSFLYLQLGIHYGKVPYVTDALETVDDVKNEAKFPRLEFNTLLDSLINFTESIPFKDQYPTGTTLNISVDGYQTQKIFINKKVILGDLYLWKGKYREAATYYRQVMETGTTGVQGNQYFVMYKLGWSGSRTSPGSTDHFVRYTRPGDATTLAWTNSWVTMFERGQDEGFNNEWVWVIPFDSKFKPENPFVKLFSPVGGSYLVKPSQSAMDLYNSQTQLSAQGLGLPYDARGAYTWRNINGQPVVMKYLYNYLDKNTSLPVNVLQQNSKWFLFRSTHLLLRFAEAANRENRFLLATAFINNGISGAYPAPGSDVTNYHNTLSEPYPYNFDARNSGNSGIPYYRADWYRHQGVRFRANVTNNVYAAADSLTQIENSIVTELGLENGFEGTRWPDLLRIALRRNDPAFIADKIYDKLRKDGSGNAAAARAKLMNRDWYLPFVW
ncbi:RagB/SusD family nutrient uptake outer membrane protein [Flavisolibacter ginsenosidimutans]|uniref:RagB/SusD family nutrient uptake outer membrane protein n=1 Tax=Flavisolibacter ginsenosidimutans TaxID=661481 RepID=A0A5B8UFZ3_9BACT|nr:RagB/SusD family nutrient uptake outer membrane protein [Flavisolibacter ginsenosidimutans]QEC55413.1 RagB/SusD family nutrient uptake outer membrane protein [Flavisolibacter ginsenosidimutans]